MTTDWWSVKPGGAPEASTSAPDAIPNPYPPPVVPPSPVQQEPGQGEPPTPEGQARSKAVKVVGGVAGALIAGVLILHGVSGGSEKPAESASAKQGEALPAAGGGPDGVLPAAGGGQPTEREGQKTSSVAPKVVTLQAVPAGKGRVGAVVKVTIHNGTDEPLTVLATMMKGDGRPAVVGEGTLAPGSRTVQPGESAEGTVEFSSSAAPHQVALLDLSGNVVAASG